MTTLVFARSGMITSAVYAAIFATMGAVAPYWPLWLAHWGLTPEAVGLYTSISVLSRMLGGFLVPALADRYDSRRLVLAISCVVSAVLLASHLLIRTEGLLLLATVAMGAASAGLGPLGEALGSAAARVHKFPYGQARALGSAGFLLTNLAVGALIPVLGVNAVLGWAFVCYLLAAALAMYHPGGGKVSGRAPLRLRDLKWLMSHPVFLAFLVAIGCIMGSHGVFFAFSSLRWRALGISEPVIGTLWAVMVLAEILLLFFLGPWVTRRIGIIGGLGAAAAAAVLRWGWLMFDPTGAVLWLIQSLHAITFAVGHLATIAFIASAIPDRMEATAQGAVLGLFGSLFIAAAIWLGSLVYDALGGLTYGVGAVMALVGLGAVVVLHRLWDRGELDGQEA